MYDILTFCAQIIDLKYVKIPLQCIHYFSCSKRCTRFSRTTLVHFVYKAYTFIGSFLSVYSMAYKGRKKTFIKIWPSMQDQRPCFIVEHDDDQTSIRDEHISEVIYYYNIHSIEGLYANHLDQLEGIGKPPCISRERLREIIYYLRNNHSNFVSCELSSVRCSGFTGEQEGSIKEEPTIAIYCRVKGFVPFNEKKFRSEFDGFKTDIRLGFIFACNDISSGRAIYHDKSLGFGSLGPIFVHPFNKKSYALSAAHIFFTSKFFVQKLQDNGQQSDDFIIDFKYSSDSTGLNSDTINDQLTTEQMDVDENDDTMMEVDEPQSQAQALNRRSVECRLENAVYYHEYDSKSKRKIGHIDRVILRTGKVRLQNRGSEGQYGINSAIDGQTGVDICTIALDENITLRDFPEEVSEMVRKKYGEYSGHIAQQVLHIH